VGGAGGGDGLKKGVRDVRTLEFNVFYYKHNLNSGTLAYMPLRKSCSCHSGRKFNK